jgi:hypothetical protein
MKDTYLNGMNDIEKMSPLRGFAGLGGDAVSTKISPLRGFMPEHLLHLFYKDPTAPLLT